MVGAPQYQIVRSGGSQHRTSRRHLNGGDTPCVQHYEPVAMSGAKQPSIVGKRQRNVLDNAVFVARRFVVRDVQMTPTDKPDPQHNLCHDRTLNALRPDRQDALIDIPR